MDFLPPRETMMLLQTSKVINSGLSLVVRPAFRILEASRWIWELDYGVPRIATVIPVFDGRRTHSILIRSQWWDQGWGERKSKLFIVGHRPDDEDFDIFSGRIVAEAPFAEHFASNIVLSFRPKRNEIYYLWYKVGGGGGHRLNIEEVYIYAISSQT